MMLGFSAPALMWLLKRLIEQEGGEVTIKMDSDGPESILYFEGSDDGKTCTLKVVRTDDGACGHA